MACKPPARSTAAEAQRARVLVALRAAPKTSYDLRRLGIYQAPARILELRRRGFRISTDLVSLVDADGYTHQGVALYTLLAEPHKKEATHAPKK
ncbi:MAG: helix-turn-helix domain-containing protein [Acidovorax sp.]|uniref:helix-turn-helix domain-containing protein n=1 Tax=Acidovorax sp. TaxID=1872122 RepID=UPI0025BD9C2E|nr:helix-turn-helix domain-containing protein [Acidovorax sp.]MCE1194225.1 helix-turn-helix domain-containing protein [Acidovorax sp.]